jgi:endonuclease/exonuclease/phosphatase family metal-dependent hydrolase
VSLLVRTWNLFHGDSVPPERRSWLPEMMELATRDDPDVVCLQEVPPWALSHLETWSGMQVFPAIAARPTIGPLPSTAELGRRLSRVDPGRLRSLFTGQANVVLLSPRHHGKQAGELVLNSWRFRRAQAQALDLDLVTRLAWAKERRVAHAVRVRFAGGERAVITNFHATGSHDKRISDAEVRRAAWFAEAMTQPDDVSVLAGDFNIPPAISRTLPDLCGPEWGYSEPAPGIDHVLVRGAGATPSRIWKLDDRQADSRVLSDHAPVDVTIG